MPDSNKRSDLPIPDTPMMAQYREAKAAYPDCLLFFRMGDFYELFFADAEAAAAALDIALTRRGDVPMAGVPWHAHEGYLARLIRQGFKVAICDQVETPAEARKRGGRTLVQRQVVRVVTPGTITEDGLLEARASNYLAALARVGGAERGSFGLAFAEITTGELLVAPATRGGLAAALAGREPGELLVPEKLIQDPALFELFGDWRDRLTVQPDARFDSENGRRRVADLFGVATLDAFGDFGRAEVAAAGALVDYLELTQIGRMPRLAPPRRVGLGATMEIDAATRRNLELTRTLSGERGGSLLATLDRTVTGAGARLLAAHLAAPLTDPPAIDRRLDGVAYFVDSPGLRADVRQALRAAPDFERALGRLALGRGGPRDLAAIRDGLTQAATIRRMLESVPAGDSLAPPPPFVAEAAAELGDHAALLDRLGRALAPSVPLLARDGGFIATGYSDRLDELHTLRDGSRRLIAELQARYASETDVPSLKIRHNNVLGYYIEATPGQAGKLAAPPFDQTFVHRQTLASAVRFTTVELGELERSIAEAADKALALELSLFEGLLGEVAGRADAIGRAAAAAAALDVAVSHAELATQGRYVRPQVDEGRSFEVRDGRHPVVEAALQAAGEPAFVANHCTLTPDEADAACIWLVTGPNMAGKSTFLRQNALIAIMAQCGSFVPAGAAHIGIVDRLFSRVGAADDLARGRSTFMVEMVETAAILHQAGPRALVILDEIGRGTATFDGLSIAWACVEHLHAANGCRALFATHYHELTALAATLPGLRCHTMRVREWQGDIVFLHEVVPGAADRSYGVHVGKLAGLPPPVVARAEQVLRTLEQGGQGRAVARLADDLPLFNAALAREPAPVPAEPSPALRLLEAVDPDELTPRAALELVYRLKAAAEREDAEP